jgi:predicted transcriptional regulator
VFDEALNELKSDGFIEIQPDGLTLVLTKVGFDFISQNIN